MNKSNLIKLNTTRFNWFLQIELKMQLLMSSAVSKLFNPWIKSLTAAQICKTGVVSSTPDATNQGLHLHPTHEISELARFVECHVFWLKIRNIAKSTEWFKKLREDIIAFHKQEKEYKI